MTIDLDRLRLLAQEPERAAMPRSEQYPSMTAQLQRQHGEINALRRGLREAVEEIEESRAVLFAAITLCNAHRWSYGGPETLLALAERVRQGEKA